MFETIGDYKGGATNGAIPRHLVVQKDGENLTTIPIIKVVGGEVKQVNEVAKYLHRMNCSIYEPDDAYVIKGNFSFVSDNETPVETLKEFIAEMIANIESVQFTGEVSFGGSPVVGLNPTFIVIASKLYIHSDVGYDLLETEIVASGLQEQIVYAEDVTFDVEDNVYIV